MWSHICETEGGWWTFQGCVKCKKTEELKYRRSISRKKATEESMYINMQEKAIKWTHNFSMEKPLQQVLYHTGQDGLS